MDVFLDQEGGYFMSVTLPAGYKPILDAYDTQRAIAFIKGAFQEEFSAALNLKRVSAPLFVTGSSGLNDDLNGCERPVSFDIPAVGIDAQVVHSLAKWKRLALKRYHFTTGNGLYTDMNAIRRDEVPDNIHSIYVDQWDWEKVITRENRSLPPPSGKVPSAGSTGRRALCRSAVFSARESPTTDGRRTTTTGT